MTEQTVKAKQLEEIDQHKAVLQTLFDLYSELFEHDGYGDMRIEMKILRRGQKEIIIHCGKQHRYVLNCSHALADESVIKAWLKKDILA